MWWRNHLVNPVVRGLARSPAHRMLGSDLVVLRYTGRRTRQVHELPVMAAALDDALVVLVGEAGRKTWWRNFADTPRAVLVVANGVEQHRSARLLRSGDHGYGRALAAYQQHFPRARHEDDAPLLVLDAGAPPEPDRLTPGEIAGSGSEAS